jgi:hypothetical protein
MPFDKGKKRKLIDSCGHERCYSCMFRNEACPLCATDGESHRDVRNSFGLVAVKMSLYSRSSSTKSPASGAGNVSEPRLMANSGECAKSCARRSVCFCSQSGGGASIGLLT